MVSELSYNDFDINKGDMTMIAWREMVQSTNEVGKQKTIDSLLKYCELDTLSMVKIWECLGR